MDQVVDLRFPHHAYRGAAADEADSAGCSPDYSETSPATSVPSADSESALFVGEFDAFSA